MHQDPIFKQIHQQTKNLESNLPSVITILTYFWVCSKSDGGPKRQSHSEENMRSFATKPRHIPNVGASSAVHLRLGSGIWNDKWILRTRSRPAQGSLALQIARTKTYWGTWFMLIGLNESTSDIRLIYANPPLDCASVLVPGRHHFGGLPSFLPPFLPSFPPSPLSFVAFSCGFADSSPWNPICKCQPQAAWEAGYMKICIHASRCGHLNKVQKASHHTRVFFDSTLFVALLVASRSCCFSNIVHWVFATSTNCQDAKCITISSRTNVVHYYHPVFQLVRCSDRLWGPGHNKLNFSHETLSMTKRANPGKFGGPQHRPSEHAESMLTSVSHLPS